jgi:hypothetical protein
MQTWSPGLNEPIPEPRVIVSATGASGVVFGNQPCCNVTPVPLAVAFWLRVIVPEPMETIVVARPPGFISTMPGPWIPCPTASPAVLDTLVSTALPLVVFAVKLFPSATPHTLTVDRLAVVGICFTHDAEHAPVVAVDGPLSLPVATACPEVVSAIINCGPGTQSCVA